MKKSDLKGLLVCLIVVLAGALYGHQESAPTDEEKVAMVAGRVAAGMIPITNQCEK